MNNYLGGPYFHEGVPIFPGIGDPGPHNPRNKGTWGPHFHMTPARLILCAVRGIIIIIVPCLGMVNYCCGVESDNEFQQAHRPIARGGTC